MKKSKFTEEQIAYAPRQVESGTGPIDVCRQLGGSEATFYIWKKKYAHLGVSELRKLRALEDEYSRLKRLVADLTLDKHMLAKALRKNVWSAPAAAQSSWDRFPRQRVNRGRRVEPHHSWVRSCVSVSTSRLDREGGL